MLATGQSLVCLEELKAEFFSCHSATCWPTLPMLTVEGDCHCELSVCRGDKHLTWATPGAVYVFLIAALFGVVEAMLPHVVCLALRQIATLHKDLPAPGVSSVPTCPPCTGQWGQDHILGTPCFKTAHHAQSYLLVQGWTRTNSLSRKELPFSGLHPSL